MTQDASHYNMVIVVRTTSQDVVSIKSEAVCHIWIEHIVRTWKMLMMVNFGFVLPNVRLAVEFQDL